jgi:hypothetical protein
MLDFVLSGVTSFSFIDGLSARRSACIADDGGVGVTLNRTDAVIATQIDLQGMTVSRMATRASAAPC